MGLIERIWTTGGEFGGDLILYSEDAAVIHRELGRHVEGPFVPADKLEGAVEALGAVIAAFDTWDNGTAEDDTTPIWDAIEAARPHAGGQ